MLLARKSKVGENMVNANENLGPAERIIQTVLAYSDHVVHNRPGLVVADTSSVTGVRWFYTKWKLEDGIKVAYRQDKGTKRAKSGKTINTTSPVRIGTIDSSNNVVNNTGVRVGGFRDPGIFPEVAVWLYKQIAEVYKLDNEFAARWASYAFMQDHEDLKVIFAAFLLVQSRKGDPVIGSEGKEEFRDLDFRDVGEAMLLQNVKNTKGKDVNLSAKQLLRVRDILALPEIAELNRKLGFSNSARNPQYGRWGKAVEKWLRYRETNPKLLKGLIKAGFRTTVMELAERSGYKPESSKFYELLRWKQRQAPDGRRTVAIGLEIQAAESWESLTEEQICEKITREKLNFKTIHSRLPESVGLTRAIMVATVEAGGLSDKEMIIATPTLEELGLLQVQSVKDRWEKAMKNANDMRAANIAKNVRSKETKEKLETAAETALQAQVAEVMRGLRVYFIVDVSGSMDGAIEAAKSHIVKCLPAFPLDQLHVSVFNTSGREIALRFASSAGVENAFKGVLAGGGTDYGEGVWILRNHPPKADEDSLFIFVGDEGNQQPNFTQRVVSSGLRPVAFGLIPVVNPQYGRGQAVRVTAAQLGIPCFEIDEKVFADPYSIPRTMRNLIAATPVGQVVQAAPRVSLIETILKTSLLMLPPWAEPATGGSANRAA